MKMIIVDSCGNCPLAEVVDAVLVCQSAAVRLKRDDCTIGDLFDDDLPIPDWCPLEDHQPPPARRGLALGAEVRRDDLAS